MDKKYLLPMGIFSTVAFFFVFYLFWYIFQQAPKVLVYDYAVKTEKSVEDLVTEKQVADINYLRAQIVPWPEEEIKEQAKDLIFFREREKPFTEEETEMQIIELIKLRSKFINK